MESRELQADGKRLAADAVTQITTYDIYVNLRIAAELGLTIAPSVVARATRVVR